MIGHALDVIKDAVRDLNPDKIPDMTCDQPLFDIGKSSQWTWPDQYLEDKPVIILGGKGRRGLHIEQAACSAVGTWLEDSGRTQAISEADVVGPATATSLLNCGHLKKTRYAHEVTASAMLLLQAEAYQQYASQLIVSENSMSFSRVEERKRNSNIPSSTTDCLCWTLRFLFPHL